MMFVSLLDSEGVIHHVNLDHIVEIIEPSDSQEELSRIKTILGDSWIIPRTARDILSNIQQACSVPQSGQRTSVL